MRDFIIHENSKRAYLLTMLLMLVGAIAQTGCGRPVGISRTNDQAWFKRTLDNALTGRSPSVYTAQYLRQRGLLKRSKNKPGDTLDRLLEESQVTPSRDGALAIAELCYLAARRYPKGAMQADRLMTSAVMYAYAYLFDPELGEYPGKFDARVRLACDLYNRSLSRVLLAARESGTKWGNSVELASIAGPIELGFGRYDMPWEPTAYHDVHTVYEFEVRGLRNHFRTSGLGVPLIALRHPATPDTQTPQDRFLQRRTDQAYPATALLRFEDPIVHAPKGEQPIRATLDLFDPYKTHEVHIGEATVGLEIDMTTPLAYMLEHAPPLSGMEGLLDVAAWKDRQGLYMLQPFQRGKIPVVFVHGLMSTPRTWLEMVNELNGDREFRDKYQIWYFLYPTGNPILYSSALLRESLRDARDVFDPTGMDPAFNQMVLVGHSMGGLVSRLNIVGSEQDGIWKKVSDQPFEELPIPENERDLLRDVFFFEPLPFVRRVVFIATPHRGSGLADLWLARLFASTVSLPVELGKAIAALTTIRQQEGHDAVSDRATSIEGLSPEHPLIAALEDLEISPEVTFHSVIANHEATTPGGTDMVVPYISSHLEGAASETIIRGTHTCTDKPDVIREVRRVLLEHARTNAG